MNLGVNIRCTVTGGRRRRVLAFVALCTAIFLISSCATQPEPSTLLNPPGFLFGLLHGCLIVVSFIGSLLGYLFPISLFAGVRIYTFPNTGIGYDFGYLLGAAVFLGGIGRGVED